MKYFVIVRATVERVYEVDADNEKDAIEASTRAAPDSETEIDAETVSVKPA